MIKSTAENHGGKATMLTAPNPNAQADLLVEAYEKAEIDPRSPVTEDGGRFAWFTDPDGNRVELWEPRVDS